MKKKPNDQRPFEAPPLEITLPPRPNYARMSQRQLLREARKMYMGLQRIWAVELQLPVPDWAILENASRQMAIFEVRCPEVCEP